MNNTIRSHIEGHQVRDLPDMNVRADDEGRTVTGIGVPYNRETELAPGLYEVFQPGSIQDDGAIYRYAHRETIGRIAQAQDTPEGRVITGVISKTQRGDEIATLVRDGVLSKHSVGFDGIEHIVTVRDDGSTLITWIRAIAREYSIVEFPAYEDAKILDVRHHTTHTPTTNMKDTTMADIARSELDTMTSTIEDLAREVKHTRALIDQAHAPSAHPFNFRSMGEYVAALANVTGDHEMAKRAFTGAIVGDSIDRPEWLGVLEKRMQAKTPILNLFMHTTDLPAKGMTVEYAVRDKDSTVQVAKQANEGDTLPKGKTGTYTTKSAPVQTFGGYGDMSRQAIERASISLLDDLFYDQAMEYALALETATRTLFTETVTANESTPIHTLGNLATLTVADWIKAIRVLIDSYDKTPYVMDALVVSTDVWDHLAALPKYPTALQFSGQPDDHQGTISLARGAGNFDVVTIQRVPDWEGSHATGIAREAIRCRETPGAPLRLQDESITDLTKTFAVYGYAAIFAPKTGLIKPFKIGA